MLLAMYLLNYMIGMSILLAGVHTSTLILVQVVLRVYLFMRDTKMISIGQGKIFKRNIVGFLLIMT